MTDDITQYNQDFNSDYSDSRELRDKCNEELRFFMVAGGQWEGFLDNTYANRIKMEIDQVSEYLYRTYGRWTSDRKLPTFSPESDESTDDDAALLENLMRRDLRRNNGTQAIDQAVFEAFACGQGAFKVGTEYEDDEDEDSEDQVISLAPLANAYSTVIWDSSATRADKADAKRCTVIESYSEEAFKEKWPDANLESIKRPATRDKFNWHQSKRYYVACRYHVERVKKEFHFYFDPLTDDTIKLESTEKDDIAELKRGGYKLLRSKKVNRRRIFKTVFSGTQILEGKTPIAGKHLPVIPVYGYRAFVDGQEQCHGLARKRMDSQRLLNSVVSLASEAAARGPEDKPIYDPLQMANSAVKASWAGDRHQKPYMLAESLRDNNGNVTHAGPVGVDPGATLSQASQSLMSLTLDVINRGTGGAPQDVLDTDSSGKAINAVLERVDMNVEPIFDNINQSIQQFGRVYQSMAADGIYTSRAGRKTKAVDRDGKSSIVTLMQMRGRGGKFDYINDLSKGRFEVVVDSGPGYKSQKEQTVEQLKEIRDSIAQTNPQDPLLSILTYKIIHELPVNNMDEVKEYVRKEMLKSGLVKPKTDEEKQFLMEVSQNQQPDPMMLAAQGEAAKGEAAIIEAQTKQTVAAANVQNQQDKTRIDAYNAETKRLAEEIDAQQTQVNIDRARLDSEGAALDNIIKRQQILIPGVAPQ